MSSYDKCSYTNKRKLTYDEAQSVIESKVKDFYNRKTGKRMNRFRRKAKEKRMYLCDHCGSYHLTSMDKKDFRSG